jgi:RecA/RadA recombinase
MTDDDFSIGEEELSLDVTSKKQTKKAEDDVKPQDITNAVEETLSEEVKEEIKTKKAKRQSKKKEEQPVPEIEEDYKTTGLTDAEMKQSKDLQSELTNFLFEHAKIPEGRGDIPKLPTGIDLLDAILGGGFGAGTLSVIVGNPGTFKTSLVGQLIGTSQKKYKGKLLAAYNDSENATTKRRLYELGVKYPPINPIDRVTVESVLRSIEAFCCFKEKNEIVEIPSIIAWDSIANTTTEKEIQSDNLDPAKVMGLKARILSSCLPIYISKMSEYNISVVAINQLREKIDMGMFSAANPLKYLGNKTMPGGNSVQYNAFHLVLLSQGADLKEESWGFKGLKLRAKCVKNKFFTPNIPIEMIVDFNTGVSNFWTNYNFLCGLKIIKPGAWGQLVTCPDVKWQGTKNALVKYHENDKFKSAFDEAVEQAIQTEITDQYTNYDELEGLEDD